MSDYAPSGNLITDKREVATSEEWSSQSDWEAFQESNNVEIVDGTLRLAEVTIPPSVVHRWPSDEGSGSTLFDAVGDADLTLSGASWVTDENNYVGGNAVDHDGLDDEANASSVIDALTHSSDHSLEVWVDLGSVGTEDIFAYQNRTSDDRICLMVDQNNANQVTAGYWDGSWIVESVDVSGLSGLMQIVSTWDAGTDDLTIYANASPGSASGSAISTGGTVPFSLGHREGDKHTDCIIDIVQIHDKTLSASEVSDRYADHPST